MTGFRLRTAIVAAITKNTTIPMIKKINLRLFLRFFDDTPAMIGGGATTGGGRVGAVSIMVLR
jgi:hypothetical protein